MESGASGISIRRAVREDADAIASVLGESFTEYQSLYTPAGYAATTPTGEQIRVRWAGAGVDEDAGFRRSDRGPLDLFGTPLFEMMKELGAKF